jgi:O-acetyl-ADP-ribose deacetylase (regulator of RNase III)
MKLLADWIIQHGGAERKIELLQGDLTRLPLEHAVDVLVVSAFPNDYLTTQGSLIGALDRAGLSVLRLSKDKQADLRQQYSCWLSKPVVSHFNFRHILCIESGWRGTPPEITDDLFRALAPYLLTEFLNSSVAMSLIGAGDQGWPSKQMLGAILRAAVNWMERGLPLKLLKIVIYSEGTARDLMETFIASKNQHRTETDEAPPVSALSTDTQYDLFLSYAHEEADAAYYMVHRIKEYSRAVRIFHDKVSLREGSTWLMQIAYALDSSRRVAALYSSNYWTSKNCQMEFLAAFTRQNDTAENILFPIYLSDAKIPYMFRSLQYSDCRVNDRIKLASACSRLAMDFG